MHPPLETPSGRRGGLPRSGPRKRGSHRGEGEAQPTAPPASWPEEEAGCPGGRGSCQASPLASCSLPKGACRHAQPRPDPGPCPRSAGRTRRSAPVSTSKPSTLRPQLRVLQPRASPTHHGGTARAALPFSPCVQACPAPSTGGQIWCLLPVHRSVCFLCGLGGLSPHGVVVSAPGQALAPGWASGQPERGRQAGEAPGPASPPRPPSGPQPPCFVPTLRVDALNDLVWLSACVPASPPEAECP